MVLMEPESSLLLSSPLTLLTDPLRLSELEAAREFFRFTADEDALPFRLLLGTSNVRLVIIGKKGVGRLKFHTSGSLLLTLTNEVNSI